MQLPTGLKSLKQFSGFLLHSITFPLVSTILNKTRQVICHTLHTCLPGHGKLLHGCHDTFRRPDLARNRSGSSAHVSSKAWQIAPQVS